MEENKSLWNKTLAELTVKEQVKMSVVAPVITAVAILGPVMIYSKVSDWRERRRTKKDLILIPVEVTEDEE